MATHIADGALFKDAQINDGKTHPIMHIALEVLGVKLNLAVWPQQKSAKGTVYWPVSGDYSNKETRRLVDVTPVFNQPAAPQGGQATPVPAAASASAPSGNSDDLPF